MMTQSLQYRFVILCVLAGQWVSESSSMAEDAKSPNFLFILADDQSWSGTPIPMMPGNQASCTAAFKMPNLAKIAAAGTIFSQAYASHPKCECSRAAILMGRTTTSLNATDKRARNWNAPARDSLANTLKRANPNYRAAHYGKWQWPQSPESMGYDSSDGITQNEDGDTTDRADPKQSFGITRRAISYMQNQVLTGHPFYLQLSYYAVHSQPQALDSTLKAYQDAGTRNPNPLQAAMTEDFDTCIGELVKTLEKLEIRKNTFVIYMSDNGGRTRTLKGGKGTVDEGGLRVPLIVSGPGVRAGVYSQEPATGYDIFPTVIDFAAPGTALPKGVEGGSWRHVLLDGESGKIHRSVDRLVFHHSVEVDHPQTALRQGDYKLVHYWDTNQDFLYNLTDDLSEQTNLAAAEPERTGKMLKVLQEHVRAGLGDQQFEALERGVKQGGPRDRIEVKKKARNRPTAKKQGNGLNPLMYTFRG
ncbi:MAG: sulfatase-like hydrolase/transferase [Planctomycetota bacterium]|nr:sulfatase-like hydrolase/transferase [Planctomycetota bacterium]